MGGWNRIAENKILEAMENGAFDNLPGRGQPLDLSVGPFEDPLAPTFRRILRDNGATHPLIEARRALEEEMAACRRRLEFAAETRRRRGNQAVWKHEVDRFRNEATALNREIKLYNLRTPVVNFSLRTLDIDATIEELSQ